MVKEDTPGRGSLWGLALALLVLLLLFGSACAPLPERAPEAKPLTRRAIVVWIGRMPPLVDQERLRAYLDRAERVYLAHLGGEAPRVGAVVLHPAASLEPPAGVSLRSGEQLRGYVQGDTMHLPWRGRYPLRAALHELHHARHGDPGHKRADWLLVDALGAQLALQVWGWGWL